MMLHMSGVIKTYPRTGVVLNGVDLSCESGEVVWISGGSGSGKSTLLSVMGLLASFEQGAYVIDGADVTSLRSVDFVALRRDVISMVFQRGNLFGHLNVSENVSVGLRVPDQSVVLESLERVGMTHRAGERAANLSGGEMQRVAIARAMARRTPLLLADEPTSSLDCDNSATVVDLLREVADSGVAVVLASHDRRSARIADRSLVLQEGKLS